MIFIPYTPQAEKLLIDGSIDYERLSDTIMIKKDIFFTQLVPYNFEFAIESLKHDTTKRGKCAKYCRMEYIDAITSRVFSGYPSYSLFYAACSRLDDNPETLNFLLEKYNPHYDSLYTNMCFQATTKNNVKILKYLLNSFSDVNHKSILTYAVYRKSIGCFELLLINRYVQDIDLTFFNMIMKRDDIEFHFQIMEIMIDSDNSGMIKSFHQFMKDYLQSNNDPEYREKIIRLGFIEN
jgi:hypothetical protein